MLSKCSIDDRVVCGLGLQWSRKSRSMFILWRGVFRGRQGKQGDQETSRGDCSIEAGSVDSDRHVTPQKQHQYRRKDESQKYGFVGSRWRWDGKFRPGQRENEQETEKKGGGEEHWAESRRGSRACQRRPEGERWACPLKLGQGGGEIQGYTWTRYLMGQITVEGYFVQGYRLAAKRSDQDGSQRQ